MFKLVSAPRQQSCWTEMFSEHDNQPAESSHFWSLLLNKSTLIGFFWENTHCQTVSCTNPSIRSSKAPFILGTFLAHLFCFCTISKILFTVSLQVLLTRIKWASITQSFLFFYSQPTSSSTWLSWVTLYPSPPCSSLWPSSSTSGNRLNVMLVRSTWKSDLGGNILLHFSGFCTLKVQRVRGLRRQLAKDITVLQSTALSDESAGLAFG